MKSLVVLSLLAALAGCSKSDPAQGTAATNGPSTATPSAPSGGGKIDMAAAKTIYDSRCGACHGLTGKGDGAGAAALNPKPRNYTDKAWQSSVTDEQIRKTIVYGGAAVGKSPVMPGSPDLDSKPEVVDGLVAIVRGFGK
jgi:mono/diheme cytochrome c family protein